MPFTKYNPFIRFVLRRIARAKGLSTDVSRDHEYTDWEQVDRFARAFVAGGATKVA
jgi:menaquinone-dependent protoporphyrinogen oxidase